MIGETVSHYRILEKLGEGGMGVVYLAEDTVLGRQVAIKTLTSARGLVSQHFRMRFLREARAVSRLSHPHIAIIYDYGELKNGQPFIVMELVRGKTLSDLIREESLTITQTLFIVRQVAEALSEAHRHGIVHRDIKPSNIAINERGNVKVLDFGLAKQVATESASSMNTQTREGVIVGTPMYLSPEQALGVEIDARSDLFSLGSVLYECIAGQPAFAGKSDADICARVIRDDPPPPSQFNKEVSQELDRITLKALAKKPEARYESADTLINDINVSPTRVDETSGPITDRIKAADQTRTRGYSFTETLKRRASIWFISFAVLLVLAGVFLAWRYLGEWDYQPKAEAKSWYDQGTRALQDGTYYKASNLMEQAIKQDPNFALAYARRAEALAELGFFDKATSEMSKANLLVGTSSLSTIDRLYLRAINAQVSHDFQQAVESYRQMIPIIPAGDTPHLYVDLGRAYEKNENLADAMASYKDAIKSNSEYAPAFLRMGIVHARQQNFAESESSLDKSLTLYRIQSNPEGMAEVMIQRGSLFVSKPDIAKARESLEGALQIIGTFSNPSQEIKTLLQLSSVYRQSRDPKTARKYATEAVDRASVNELSDLKTLAIIELGYGYFFDGDIANAEQYFKEALERAKSDNVRVTEARAQFALGSLHIQQDEVEEGVPLIRAALPFYQQNVYRKEVMQSQTLLGQAYAIQGQHSEALRAFEDAIQLAQTLNSQREAGLLHKSIATVLGDQEKYTAALDHLEQSYAIFNSLGNNLYLGYTFISRADMKWRLGYYDDAAADLNLATALAERPDGFKQLWGRIYSVKAPMALSQRRFAEAITYAKQAIALDTSRTQHPAIEAQYTLGLAQFLSNQESKGKTTCEHAVRLADGSAYPKLIVGAALSLAEILLETNNAEGALAHATKAQELAASAEQLETVWRASLIVRLANERLRQDKAARESSLRADTALSELRQRWGLENYQKYLTRLDIAHYINQFKKASNATD